MKLLANSQRLIAALFLATALTSGFALAAPPQNKFVSVKELNAVLSSENLDAAVKTLNDVKGMIYKGEIIPFVDDLWHLRKEKHPNVAWHVVEKKVIRLELANILLQARKNGYLKFDPQDMAEFAISQLRSRDFWVRYHAISVLGLTESDFAVQELLKIATREDDETFRAASFELVRMCNPNANRAVADLLVSVKDRIRRKYIKESIKKWDDFNRGHTWCETVKSRLK